MLTILKRLLELKEYEIINQIQRELIHKINYDERYKIERLDCLCGKDNSSLIAYRDRYGIKVKIVLCNNCGLIRTDPYYTDSSLDYFYKNDYRPLYSGQKICNYDFFLEQIETGKQIYNYVKDYLPKKSNNQLTVFEIGCGAGGILKYFQELGFKVVGNDYANDYLEYGRRHSLNLVSDINKLSKYGKADLIILNHVFEHLKYPLQYLSEIKGMLNNDGLVYIALPGIKYIGKTYNSDFKQYLQNAHIYYYCLETLCYVLNLAGFGLMQGTEEIQSIFKLNNKYNYKIVKNISKRIYLYIIYLEISYKIRNFILFKYMIKLAKGFTKIILFYL